MTKPQILTTEDNISEAWLADAQSFLLCFCFAWCFDFFITAFSLVDPIFGHPSPAQPTPDGLLGLLGLLVCWFAAWLLLGLLVCWFAAWPAAWLACCFALAAFTRPSPDNQNPTKENARTIMSRQDNQATTKTAQTHAHPSFFFAPNNLFPTARSRGQCSHTPRGIGARDARNRHCMRPTLSQFRLQLLQLLLGLKGHFAQGRRINSGL